MRGQSRKHSFAEAIINVAVGYFVSLLTQIAIFPLFGIKITLAQNISIGLVFTAISIIRSYCLRRLFNSIMVGRR